MPSSIDYTLLWAAVAAVASVVGSVTGVIVAFRRKERVAGELYTTQLERDDLRRKWAASEARLDGIDPERFLDRLDTALQAGDFVRAEELSERFATRQSEAFGRAAEVLAEQSILDSGTGEKGIAEDALRFARIGRAADPDNLRLAELEKLAQTRLSDIARGDPVEALDWTGLSDEDLVILSERYYLDGDYALAEAAARRAVPLAAVQAGDQSARFTAALSRHARGLSALGLFAEAEDLCRKALEIDRERIGEDHPVYLAHLNTLSDAVQEQGRHDEAETILKEVIAKADRSTPAYRVFLGNYATSVSRDPKRQAKAEGLFRDLLALFEESGETESLDYTMTLNNLGHLVESQGRPAEAEDLFARAVGASRISLGPTHPVYALQLHNLAFAMSRQDRHSEAVPLYREALDISRKTIGEGHPRFVMSLKNLAQALEHSGQPEEAERLYHEVLALDRKTITEAHPDHAVNLNNLATFLANAGRRDEARAPLEQALKIMEAAPDADPEALARMRRNLDELMVSDVDGKQAE